MSAQAEELYRRDRRRALRPMSPKGRDRIMSKTLEALRQRMEAAAAAMDFEEAARLRDRISLLRGRPEADSGDGQGADDGQAADDEMIDTSRLSRQQPGRMGLGTSEQVVERPPGWTPPARPDPMTTTTRPAKRRRAQG